MLTKNYPYNLLHYSLSPFLVLEADRESDGGVDAWQQFAESVLHKASGFVAFHGFGKVVALAVIAAELSQFGKLLDGFDAFGYYVKPQIVR